MPTRLSSKTKIAAVARIPTSMEIWAISDDGLGGALDGAVQGLFWYHQNDGKWHRYSLPAEAGRASVLSNIAVVARRDDTMEVFWISPDGAVWNAHWYANDYWRTYCLAGPGSASVQGGIAAISRRPDTINVFWIGSNRGVVGKKWVEGHHWVDEPMQERFVLDRHDQNLPDPAAPDSRIVALSRRPDTIEIWWSSENGTLWNSHWYDMPGFTHWRSYPMPVGGKVGKGSGMAAISRRTDTLEIWWVDPQGTLWDASWYEWKPAGQQWQAWQLTRDKAVAGNSGITAVCRRPDTMEVFWIDPHGGVHNMNWYEGRAGNQWSGYLLSPAGSASPEGGITAISRIPESIEVWWTRSDGVLHDGFWYEGSNTGWGHFNIGEVELCIEVKVPHLHCVNISEERSIPIIGRNDTDEVYMIAVSSTPQGVGSAHLPRREGDDDYYPFKSSQGDRWVNRDDNPVGQPRLWHGMLKPGEQANFQLFIMEQDNADIGSVKEFFSKALEAAGPLVTASGDPYVAAGYAGAKFLVAITPDIRDHDIIGMLAINVLNHPDAGCLIFTVLPVGADGVVTTLENGQPYMTLSSDNVAEARFVMKGTRGSHYIGVVQAAITRPPPVPL